jgi:3-hydroxypropanoate dehydrogenase
VDREFFGRHNGTDAYAEEHFPDSHVRTNFICNLGYGDPKALRPRNPRLPAEEACVFM